MAKNPVELTGAGREALGKDQKLQPILDKPDATLQNWIEQRKRLRKRWLDLLGKPTFEKPLQAAETVDHFEAEHFRGTALRQPTGPDARQLVYVLEPKRALHFPRPGAVVPFYHPDLMAGYDHAKDAPVAERPLVQFGSHLARQGYVAVCTEAFPYNTVADPKSDATFAWWRAATRKVLAENPNWTGMGKLVWDTSLALDLLLEQPDVDAERVVVIGHSLGGKMAFYTGCLDERVKAVIASDFGIGYDFTNWGDPWYLGSKLRRVRKDLKHHQLLALLAPRAFLLIAGQYDKRESRQYLLEAQKVYKLYGRGGALGMFDHASGHQPTREAMLVAYKWLARQFGLQEVAFDL